MILSTKLARVAHRLRMIVRANYEGRSGTAVASEWRWVMLMVDTERSIILSEEILSRSSLNLTYTMIGKDWEIKGGVENGEERALFVMRWMDRDAGCAVVKRAFFEDAAIMLLRYPGT